jgi:hypothetical protein
MTDDIVARLRNLHPMDDDVFEFVDQAADDIERLRAEIARKDAALRAIAEHDTDADGNWGFFRDEADAALEGEKTDA